jgi:hypothetical protein
LAFPSKEKPFFKPFTPIYHSIILLLLPLLLTITYSFSLFYTEYGVGLTSHT